MRTISVIMDETTLLCLLEREFEKWDLDASVEDLFMSYYEDNIDMFEGMEFDPRAIVDNDYINNYSVYTKREIEENDVGEEYIVYEKNGLYLVEA